MKRTKEMKLHVSAMSKAAACGKREEEKKKPRRADDPA
jgi:hypothetical protein